jgi:hypothetical protein
MDKKFIRIEPVKGRLVRVPETGREVAEPMKVQATSFWRRRIAAGDVRKVEDNEVQK